MAYKSKDAVDRIVQAFHLNSEKEETEDVNTSSNKSSFYKSIKKQNRIYNMRTSDHHTVLKTWVIKHKDDLTILKESYNFAITFLDDFSKAEPTSGKSTINENTIKYVYDSILKNCRKKSDDIFLPEISGLFKVITFIYNSKELNRQDLNKIIDSINNVISGESTEYIDPLSKHPKKFAHVYEMSPNQDIKAVKIQCNINSESEDISDEEQNNDDSKQDSKQENLNYSDKNTAANNSKKALYESIIKDVARIVKKVLLEHETY